ncbi:MAG: DUF3604 domain-containing protein [Anaerolineales bacterium]|nr:DUF3604 domain-containing protein [Anaerolineales bacterium]
MNRNSIVFILMAVVLAVVLGGTALAQEYTIEKEDVKGDEPDYSPYVDRNIPTQVFWGDTHLHTSYSPDAGMIGNTLGPEEAYRFARGEEVTTSTGLRAKLIRPLDFLVVSDHAEYIGLAPMLRNSDPILLSDPTGKRWHDMFQQGRGYDAFIEIVSSVTQGGEEQIQNPQVKRSVWEGFTKIADEYNDPGKFTAFIGFEWSSVPKGNNLHRVVIFRDDADRANQVVPYSQFDSFDPEDLWRYMAAYEEKTGGQMLALAHNGNWSNGLMFAEKTFTGKPIDQAYAETRIRWEPLYEVTQIKGDGEAHPFLSPEDEFADYENWDKGNLDGSVAKENWMLQYEYARSALKLGLKLEDKTGTNPYKFGMVGSTDSHTSLSTTREENYFGKFAKSEPEAERYKHEVVRSQVDPNLTTFSAEEVASGLAAVWARENTRESIFDAMKRKEVYATTGTRILVRVFAGWDFEADEVERPDFADQGYRRGVPMGGGLANAPKGKSPAFMVRALRDADGANLDRIQIIKGWLDKDGDLQERIYDVAVSDGREIGSDGRCKTPVGNTVDVANASYTNSIGSALLMAYWKDPDFDPNERALYYVRVIEIPTPRWTAYDAKRFGIEMPDHVEMTTQDRAYTSPIWYTP